MVAYFGATQAGLYNASGSCWMAGRGTSNIQACVVLQRLVVKSTTVHNERCRDTHHSTEPQATARRCLLPCRLTIRQHHACEEGSEGAMRSEKSSALLTHPCVLGGYIPGIADL